MPQFNPNDLKILYAIQGTGNGHIARAMEIIPLLKEYGEVDIVLSGDHKNIDFPMPIKYRSKGLSFAYNKNGGLSFLKIDKLGEWVLKNYAPVTKAIGFHFDTFDNFVYRPVIRKEVRELEVSNEGYFTVYLPAYGDEYLKKYLSQIPEKRWEIFSKNCKEAYSYKNLHFKPTQNQAFVESLTKCEGILCSAGFETPAEALYLGKKLFTIPIKNQYEQYCNAAALESIGVGVSYSLNSQTIETIKDWARDSEPLKINYPNQTKEIIRREIFDEVRLSILEKDINIERVIY